jgi:hypothetical protein
VIGDEPLFRGGETLAEAVDFPASLVLLPFA